MKHSQLFAVLALSALISFPIAAVEIDFTRFLQHVEATSVAGAAQPAEFIGVPGDARLIVSGPGPLSALQITLNGELLAVNGQPELPVTLAANNSIAINTSAPINGPMTVRIKQIADVVLHVISRVHFNTNVSDFEAARAFYGKLGFTTLSGFPDTNTQAMARAIGVATPTDYDGSAGGEAGGYLLHGELIGQGFMGGVIDLIEFTVPRRTTPPYARLNHLGMARAVLHTTDLDADYAYMNRLGVAFIAPPAARADGTRFVIFKDLDGTHYELAEIAGDIDDTDTTHITGFGPLNVNVSDFERSSAWYQMLGHTVTRALPATESLAVARAMGFEQRFSVEGAVLTLPADGSTLELVQWREPFDPQPPYDLPVNHLGIHRTAFATTDMAADVATLKAQGVQFVSPVTPCCSGPDSSGSIVAFYDPDGTVVELVEQPFMGWLIPVMLWFRDTFF